MSQAEDLLAIHLKELGVGFEREWRFWSPRKWRFDFWLPGFGTGIEVEGGTYSGGRHTRGAGFDGDCEKYNMASALGIKVFRFTTKRVFDGTAKSFIDQWVCMRQGGKGGGPV